MDVEEIKAESPGSSTEEFTPYVSKKAKKALKRKRDDVVSIIYYAVCRHVLYTD